MKYIILAALFVGFGALLQDDKVELIKDMQTTCHRSYYTQSGALELECGKLIDRIQENEALEVISDQGYFWVESKEVK